MREAAFAFANPVGVADPLNLRRLDVLDLPVESVVPRLRRALAASGRAVLQAEPGAGKTTAVPLRLLPEPWLGSQRIVVLEPRRLATRAAARRMAWLLGEEVGETVGYVTRDERRVGDRTRVEVVTEGVLTRRLQRDPSLPGTGLVMFDEFHERNLQADLGLALALEARAALRPDLRVLVASATLDVDRVATLLGDGDGPVPVVASEGRGHPVEVTWRPRSGRRRLEPDVADAVAHTLRRTDGDVLVFLPGAAAIRRTESLLAGADPGGGPIDVRPLFGGLSAADQDRALAPSPVGRRKVVLATDIAETSLTVEGVTAVVDSGLARAPRFDPRTGMTRLQTITISKASADQRTGRAGRTEPGTAVRLWSKMEHAARRPHTEPEITQVDLAGLALELAAWGAGGPEELPFLDPPPGPALAEARTLLTSLGALDADGRLTPTGRTMVGLPLHPRLARMVVGGLDSGRGWTACLLAALLEERDVLQGRPEEVPADLALRLDLLTDRRRRHPRADGRRLRAARDRARDLARRARIRPGEADSTEAGPVLLLGYPDRLAQARSTRGRFRLRASGGAWVPETDVLAGEELLVVADLDGDRREARIRLAAPIDVDDVLVAFDDQVDERRTVSWDRARDDLTVRVEQRLGGVVLQQTVGRPQPGEETTAALLDRVRETDLAVLSWSERARSLQRRVAFVGRHSDQSWPDLSDQHLRNTLEDWLAPLLPGATGREDLVRVEVTTALRARLTAGQVRALERLAPPALTVPSGRSVALDYSEDPPVLAVRVQELFGLAETPTVLGGRLPVVLHLLSPANRPIQITRDLAGFWAGTWADVRKEMAGRYPKHPWPVDPVTASPVRR